MAESTASWEKEYDEKKFFAKITNYAVQIGIELVYKALELYYVTKNPDCPLKVKIGIYSALAYLVSPLDIIPDMTPGIGYTDDMSVIATAIVMAQMYIDDEVKQNAYTRLVTIFGEKLVRKIRC